MSVRPPLPELISPEEAENWPRAFLRRQFLEILDEEEPEAKQQLKSELFPSFQQTMRSAFPHATDLRAFLGRFFDVKDPSTGVDYHGMSLFPIDWYREIRSGDPKRVQPFARVLDDWQCRYHLQAEWIEDTAIRTLAAWTIWPEVAERGEWIHFNPAFRGAALLGELSLAGRVDFHWDPVIETRASARKRIVRRVCQATREYAEPRVDLFLDEVERRARERGLVEPPNPREEERHLRWLVRHQVRGETFTDIARGTFPKAPKDSGRKSVAAGVRNAADLIGLTLRPTDPGGRPSSS